MKERKSEDISTEDAKARLIKKYTPKSPKLKNCFLAAIGGGTLCAVAEALRLLLIYAGLPEKDALTLVSVIIIALGAILTALGVFDKIARHLGAGTLVPITGFSNSVVSQAIDARSEGLILGVGAKIFTVAGPVILFGICAGVIYGAIYYGAVYLLPMLGQMIQSGM